MTYFLILWMFACPNFFNVAEKFHPPTFIEEKTYSYNLNLTLNYNDWGKSRLLKECENGLAVWAKPKRVTKVEPVWKDGESDKNGNISYLIIEEVKTVVYERE